MSDRLMVSEILTDENVTARKDYPCDACWLWLDSGWALSDISEVDRTVIRAAKADGWKILAGQKYRRVVYREGGTLRTYRARPDVDSLVQWYDMGDE